VIGQHADRSSVRHAGSDVRPLARVWALGEQAPELVEVSRRRAQNPVRVVVDGRRPGQYFSK
jgi:hypothetical protein